MKTRILISLLAFLAVGWLAGPAFAAYNLDWSTVDGGGERSTGGTYTLEGTAGQHDAGGISGGTYSLYGGFWLAVEHNLVINEIDYDNKDTDDAEFVELKNISSATIDFSVTPYVLDLINGSDGTSYKTINIDTGTVNANDYFVVCGDQTTVPNCDLDSSPDSGFLQNDTEAVVLKSGGVIVDRVSYEGTVTGYVEGTAAGADSDIEALISLSRYADGTDSGDNSSDFALKCVTPGSANSIADSSGCFQLSVDDPTAVTEGDSGTQTISFTVSLSHAAAQAVTVSYATADDTATTAGSDYDNKTGTVTFAAGSTTPSPASIDVTVNGDEIDEGASETFKVNLSSPSDNAQLSATAGDTEGIGIISDDDDAGFTVSKTTASVNESGTEDTFTVVLDTEPTSAVVISVTSADIGEATVSATPALPLTFTPTNWDTAQTVTVTGMDDVSGDGDQTTAVTISVVDADSDNEFDSLTDTVSVTTEDNDTPGFTITPTSGLITTEAGGTATFTVVLNTLPTVDVTLPLSSSDPTEGTVSPASLVFTTGNWNSARTVTVTGKSDTDNADVIYTIQTGAANSTDVNYGSMNPADVTVTNQNVVPNVPCTDITLSGALSIPENSPAGTTVGTLSATDADGGPHTFYAVTHSTGPLDRRSFSVVGNTLATAEVFDYEVKNTYSVYMRANDDFGASCFSRVFGISVTDVNEPPTGLILSYRWVDEEAPAGTKIGEFTTAGDPDAGESFSYALVSGDGSGDNGLFSVDGNVLKMTAPPDYETSEKHAFNIRARTTDKGGLGVEKAFTVTLNNLNEPPTDITLDNAALDEGNTEIVPIGKFSSADVNPGDRHTYALVSGEGDTDNWAFLIQGDTLRTQIRFDFEDPKKKTAYGIRVLTDDGHGGTFAKSFTVTVNDVNDAPVISSVPNQEIRSYGEAVSLTLNVTVGDQDTPAEKLALSAESSDAALLPLGDIVFGGSGTARTVTLTPEKDKSGKTTVTLTVSDGELSAETTFVLDVAAGPHPVFGEVTVEPDRDPDTPVRPGDTLTYVATVPNTGDSDAEDIVFVIPVPDNTTLVPGSIGITGGDGDFPDPEYDSVTNEITWQGDIPADTEVEIVFEVTVNGDIQPGDVIPAPDWTLDYDSDGDGESDATQNAGDNPEMPEAPPVEIVVPEPPGPDCLPGDVNGDGILGLEDAVLVLQILVGIAEEEADICADADGDGQIGIAEAVYILRKLAQEI